MDVRNALISLSSVADLSSSNAISASDSSPVQYSRDQVLYGTLGIGPHISLELACGGLLSRHGAMHQDIEIFSAFRAKHRSAGSIDGAQ